MSNRACVECGATYTPRMATQRRCSACSARRTGRYPKEPIACRGCGARFLPEHRCRRYCLACRPSEKPSKSKACKRCEETFTPPNYQQQYCDTCRKAVYLEKCRAPKKDKKKPPFVIKLGVTRAGQATWWEARVQDIAEIAETRRAIGWPHVWRQGGWHSE